VESWSDANGHISEARYGEHGYSAWSVLAEIEDAVA